MPLSAALLAAALVLSAQPVRDAAWAASLKPGETVRLPAGLYRGPWKLGPRVHLIGSLGAVLQGGDPALTIAGNGVRIEALSVEADPGGVGVEAIDAEETELIDVRIAGGARGLKATGGSIHWHGGGVERSTRFGIWLRGTRAIFSDLQLRDNPGSALFGGHADVQLAELAISGAEFGVLVYESKLRMRATRVERVSRTGAGLVRTSATIEGCDFVGPFSEAALSVLTAKQLVLSKNRIEKAGSMGIKMMNTVALLSKNEISGARCDARGIEGDGLYASNCDVRSSGDRLRDNGGATIAQMGGKGVFTSCEIEGAGQVAAYVSDKGELTLSGCGISQGSTELLSSPGSTLKNDPPIR